MTPKNIKHENKIIEKNEKINPTGVLSGRKRGSRKGIISATVTIFSATDALFPSKQRTALQHRHLSPLGNGEPFKNFRRMNTHQYP
jgi:hypothetical protein